MPREQGQKVVAQNRKARHDYTIEDRIEAGLVLTGTEVKSLRAGRASLVDGYAFIEYGEAWLDAVHIAEYGQGTWTNHPPRRKRKLLLHRDEIDKLAAKVAQGGYTLVPLSLYFSDGRAKVELAVAKGKKEYDKRHALRALNDDDGARRALALRLLAVNRWRVGDTEAAARAADDALELYQALADSTGEAETLNVLCMVYNDLGLHRDALEHAIRALRVARAAHDRRLECWALNRIGVSYEFLDDPRLARLPRASGSRPAAAAPGRGAHRRRRSARAARLRPGPRLRGDRRAAPPPA